MFKNCRIKATTKVRNVAQSSADHILNYMANARITYGAESVLKNKLLVLN